MAELTNEEKMIMRGLSKEEVAVVNEAMEEFQAELDALVEKGIEDMIAHDKEISE